MKNTLKWISTLLIAASFAVSQDVGEVAVVPDDTTKDPGLKPGDLAPSWALMYAPGKFEFLKNWTVEKDQKLRKFMSQPDRYPVVMSFFATWCKPCRDEHIYIERFSNEKGIKVIGINYKDNSKKAIQWLKELGNPYTNVAVDKSGRIAIDWGVYGIPETFIVNSEGIIKYRHVGAVTKKIYKKIILIINENK